MAILGMHLLNHDGPPRKEQASQAKRACPTPTLHRAVVLACWRSWYIASSRNVRTTKKITDMEKET